MAGPVLLKHIPLFLAVLSILCCVRASKKRTEQDIDRCRNDLSRCYRRRSVPCLGSGYNIQCYGQAQRCNGIYECPWGEDETNCGLPIFPATSIFSTRTVFRTVDTTTTSTSTKTTTRTSSTSTTSTFTSTVLTTSITSTSVVTTATGTAPSSIAATTSTITSSFPSDTSAVLVPIGAMLNGGFTCQLLAAAPNQAIQANDYLLVQVTRTLTLAVTLTPTCSATTTTFLP